MSGQKGFFFLFSRFNVSDPNPEFVGLEVIIKGVQHLPVPIAIPRQNGLLGLSIILNDPKLFGDGFSGG